MSRGERVQAKFLRVFRRAEAAGGGGDGRQDVEKGGRDGSGAAAVKKQYRLEATRTNTSGGFLKLISCGLLGRRSHRRGGMTGNIGINPNQQLSFYLHWMFRVNFLFLFCVMCVMFFVLVMFFAVLIIIAGELDNECVRIGGTPFGEADSEFADAFALSWTTFSTVVRILYVHSTHSVIYVYFSFDQAD
jgi:hypothetical protein